MVASESHSSLSSMQENAWVSDSEQESQKRSIDISSNVRQWTPSKNNEENGVETVTLEGVTFEQVTRTSLENIEIDADGTSVQPLRSFSQNLRIFTMTTQLLTENTPMQEELPINGFTRVQETGDDEYSHPMFSGRWTQGIMPPLEALFINKILKRLEHQYHWHSWKKKAYLDMRITFTC